MPVDFATIAAFSAASFAIVLSPGPDTMLILRYTMSGGQRIGLATVAGVQIGLLVHTLAAVLGLSLVIASAPVLFQGIAVAGALYLGWLAIESVRAGVVRLNGDGPGNPGPVLRARKACRDAVLCNVLNPKVILLFLALMPNFVETGRGQVPVQLAVLGVVLVIINLIWQLPLAFAAEAIRRWLGSPAVQRGVNWGTGGVLMLFAVLMLYEHIF